MTDLPAVRGRLTPNRELSELTWLRVGGPADYLFQPADLADLQAFLRFYDFERPHRGYRTKGRTPASIFFRERPEILSQMGA